MEERRVGKEWSNLLFKLSFAEALEEGCSGGDGFCKGSGIYEQEGTREADRRYPEEDAEGGNGAELRGSSRIQRQDDITQDNVA